MYLCSLHAVCLHLNFTCMCVCVYKKTKIPRSKFGTFFQTIGYVINHNASNIKITPIVNDAQHLSLNL
jgi:hypothetical protein